MSARDEIKCSLGELFNELGEQITLHGSPFRAEVLALVNLDEPAVVEDEIPDLEGTIRLRDSDARELSLESDPVLTATIRGETWHLFGPPSSESGMITLNIRRHRGEEPYGNYTDMNDNQIRLR